MKHVIGFLEPQSGAHATLKWWYFTGFDWECDGPQDSIRSTLQLTDKIGEAFVFEDHMLLHNAQERLNRYHPAHIVQVLSVSDRTLFDARLKGI